MSKKNEAPKVEGKENKDFTRSKLVQDFLDLCKKKGIKTPSNTPVGNNGFPLGATFTIMGVEPVETKINGNDTVYMAFTTKEGQTISVKTIMGVSSLNGFETEGKFAVESDINNEKVTKDVTANVVEGFSFRDAFHTPLGLLDFLAQIEDENNWSGKKLTYLGNVVRPIVARSISPVTSFEKYKAGYKRAITSKLWHVE